MSQPNDPWAAATPVAAASPVQQYAPTPTPVLASIGGGISGAFGPAAGQSRLFTQRTAATSLFNKTHPLGTERTGIIGSVEEKQDRDMDAGLPKFWSLSKVGGATRNKAVTTDAIDAPTGQANQPIIVTHISLNTDYRLTAEEAMAISNGKTPRDITQDDGTRIEVVKGLDEKAFYEAIVDARARGIALPDENALTGKRLTVKRIGQKPNPGYQPSWVKAYRIDNA